MLQTASLLSAVFAAMRAHPVPVIPGGGAGFGNSHANWRQKMSDMLELSAGARERAGKGASRAMRREGRVPAVVYGNKQEPTAVHIEEKALMKMLHGGHFFNSVVMIDVG